MTRDEWSALKAEGQIGAESPIGAVARPWRNFLRLVAHVERLEAVKDAAERVETMIENRAGICTSDGAYKALADALCVYRAALAATKEPDRG